MNHVFIIAEAGVNHNGDSLRESSPTRQSKQARMLSNFKHLRPKI